MPDIATDIRIAVDSGKVAIGANSVIGSMHQNKAKLVVVAIRGNKTATSDIQHLSNVTGIEVIKFEGDSMQLGAVCGKPYSVSTIAVMDSGNSHILENYKEYGKKEAKAKPKAEEAEEAKETE